MAKNSNKLSSKLDPSPEERSDLLTIKKMLHAMLKELFEDHDDRINKLETVIFTKDQNLLEDERPKTPDHCYQ